MEGGGVTLVLLLFLDGDLDAHERCRYHIVDMDAARADSQGRAAIRLMDVCDGRCYDRCSSITLASIDRFFDLLETGLTTGWAIRGQGRTVVVPQGVRVTRVVMVTGVAGGVGADGADYAYSDSEEDARQDQLANLSLSQPL